MNKVIIMGRLTAKPELRYTPANVAYTRFSVAVNRPFARQDGTRETDFINVVAWNRNAENISRYFDKGSQICLEGSIRTGNYTDKEGNRRYTTDVNLDNFDFVGSRRSEDAQPSETPYDFQESTQQVNNNVTNDSDPFADFGDSVSIDENFLD